MSLTILAVDTTGEFGSIALWRGELVEEVALHSRDGFSALIFGEIDRLLKRHSVAVADVDAFAAASGPGSFTGVRVGLTAMKGLGEATGRPVVGISNLQALATFGTHAMRATVIDARRGQIYGSVYDSQYNLVAPEVVTGCDAWVQSLPAGDVEIIGQSDFPQAGRLFTHAPREMAAAVARLAAIRLAAGVPAPPEAADANYVRRSDAELFWTDPRLP